MSTSEELIKQKLLHVLVGLSLRGEIGKKQSTDLLVEMVNLLGKVGQQDGDLYSKIEPYRYPHKPIKYSDL